MRRSAVGEAVLYLIISIPMHSHDPPWSAVPALGSIILCQGLLQRVVPILPVAQAFDSPDVPAVT